MRLPKFDYQPKILTQKIRCNSRTRKKCWNKYEHLLHIKTDPSLNFFFLKGPMILPPQQLLKEITAVHSRCIRPFRRPSGGSLRSGPRARSLRRGRAQGRTTWNWRRTTRRSCDRSRWAPGGLRCAEFLGNSPESRRRKKSTNDSKMFTKFDLPDGWGGHKPLGGFENCGF